MGWFQKKGEKRYNPLCVLFVAKLKNTCLKNNLKLWRETPLSPKKIKIHLITKNRS